MDIHKLYIVKYLIRPPSVVLFAFAFTLFFGNLIPLFPFDFLV